MPRISSFYGIAIYMYFGDHAPEHFHAIYGEYEAKLSIGSLQLLEGWIPRRTLRLVREWAEIHRGELKMNWARAQQSLPLDKIEPLP